MKEKLGRRTALKAIGVLGVADLFLALSYHFGDEALIVARYLEAYKRGLREGEASPLTEIESNIIIDSSLDNEKVRANRSAFALAAVVVAMHQDPKMGLFKLNTFLRKFPLTITAPTYKTLILESASSHPGTRFAYYQPLYMGGPKIVFENVYFDAYKHGKYWTDPQMQLNADTAVYHELVHLNQESADPFAFSSKYPDLSSGDTSYYDVPLEVEAYAESERIIREEYQKVVEANTSYWPFGDFFEFNQT